MLWTNDAAFSHAKLPERYGEYLKADILQIPHHGFQSGSAEAEISGYDLIRPRVCLLPVSDYCAYTFCKKVVCRIFRRRVWGEKIGFFIGES